MPTKCPNLVCDMLQPLTNGEWVHVSAAISDDDDALMLLNVTESTRFGFLSEIYRELDTVAVTYSRVGTER